MRTLVDHGQSRRHGSRRTGSTTAGATRDAPRPQVLGIDEHFFSRRLGYATTLCDLRRNKVFDVVLGRSEKSLESYLGHLKGKEGVKVVCMDLSVTYRSS